MGVIIPAILPTSREDLEEKLARLEGLTDFVQIDVIDGKFAAPACWPYSGGTKEFAAAAAAGENLPFYGRLKFDIDLMVLDSEQVAGSWIGLGASRLTIHAESTSYLPKLLDDLTVRYGHDRNFTPDLLSFGLALGLRTDVAIIEPYLSQVDYVQFMGIASIGKQGEPFDSRVIERVKNFRKRYPDIKIQVDGGVSRTTAPLLLEAGVDRLVVGSALWRAADLKEELAAFAALTEEYGLYES